MSGIEGGLHVRPEDVVTLPRVDALISMFLKEAAHVLLELLLGGSFLGSFCQTVKEPVSYTHLAS